MKLRKYIDCYKVLGWIVKMKRQPSIYNKNYKIDKFDCVITKKSFFMISAKVINSRSTISSADWRKIYR